MMSEEAEDAARMKRIAEIELAKLSESRRMLLEEHSAAFRWLIASLLAVNGGAIALVADVKEIEAAVKVWPIAVFAFGLVCALLTALASQFANRRMVGPIDKMAGYWVYVAQMGKIDSTLFNECAGEVESTLRSVWLARLPGWLSAAAFVAGTVYAGALILQAADVRPVGGMDLSRFEPSLEPLSE